MKSRKSQFIICLMLALIGCCLIIVQVKLSLDKEFYKKNYIAVEGYIVDIKETKLSSDDDWSYKAIVEYTVDGTSYRLNSPSRWKTMTEKINSVITVRYNPNNPSQAVADFSGYGLIFVLLGLVFIGYSMYPFIYRLKKKNKK